MVKFYARRLGGSLALALLIQLYGSTNAAAATSFQHGPYATWTNITQRNETGNDRQQLPLKSVLAGFEQQYKVHINYTGNTINGVTVQKPADKQPTQKLVDYLNEFLHPLGLEAEQAATDNFIVYKKDKQKPTINQAALPAASHPVAGSTQPLQIDKIQQQLSTVTGQVTEESGLPLPGVTIIVKGTFNGAKTNDNGKFVLNNVPPNGVLVFSFIGYKTQEIKVNTRTSIDIKLLTDVQSMKDVVINGYQKLNKESYTGSAIVITGEEIKRFNPTNLLSSIAAYDPSFHMVDNNLGGSNPNALPNINVRGTTATPSGTASSLSRAQLSNVTNLPLFIMDGYQVGIQTIYDLDINRIQTITLLKDAAATSIYGSRASNGVVMIQTKVPKEGNLEVYYTYMLGVVTPDLSGYHLLNASQKLEYERLAGLYKPNNVDNVDDLEANYYAKRANVLGGVNTDWIAQPVQTQFNHNNSLSIAGGTHDLRYSVDARYQTDGGVMKGSNRDRYNIGNTLAYNLKNNKIMFRNTFTLTQMKSQESPYGTSEDAFGSNFGNYHQSFRDYAKMNPYYPLTDSLGRTIQEVDKWNYRDPRIGNAPNTVAALNPLFDAKTGSFNRTQYLEFIDAFGGEYNPTPNLKISGNIALTKRNTSSDKFISPLGNEFFFTSSDHLKDRGKYYYTTIGQTNLEGSLTASYNKLIAGSHYLNLSVATNIQTTKVDERNIVAQGFTNDRFAGITFAREYGQDDGEKTPVGGVEETRLVGYLAAANYSYQNRFLFDGTVRVDGSSKFGANARFAPFWSTGVGWNVHNEKFMRNSVINQLKLKGTVGLTGSTEFPAYLSNTTYGYYSNDWYSTGPGAVFTTFGNDSLKWSRTLNYEGTMEISAFKERLYISPHYYYKLTKDLINDRNVAPSDGFNTYSYNIGNVVNKGYELYVRANILRGRVWSANVFMNLRHNTNILTKLSNSLKQVNDNADKASTDSSLHSVPLQRFAEGRSMNTLYGVKSLGIDPETGKEVYLNKDGKTTTYVYDVKNTVPIGDNTEKISGNFGANVVYKNFMMEVQFRASLGADIYNETLLDLVENADPRFNVDSRALTERWKKPGDHTFFKNIADNSQTGTSSRFVQKENMIQWSSLFASYDAPAKLYNRLKMKSLRLSFNMNDLAYWSNVERVRGVEYPYAHSFTFSLSTRF